jgi:predicted ribosome quality control (RQC) complex YloA/Tae2 family protein
MRTEQDLRNKLEELKSQIALFEKKDYRKLLDRLYAERYVIKWLLNEKE